MMPGLTVECRMPRRKDVRIVLGHLTVRDGGHRAAVEPGADDYLIKPLSAPNFAVRTLPRRSVTFRVNDENCRIWKSIW